MAGVVDTVMMLYFGCALFFPPLTMLARRLLPDPGEGPSEETMEKSFLKVTGFARGFNGTEGAAAIWFPTDPGYRDTARMLVESGLALACEEDKLTSVGGVWMPACGIGDVLRHRLVLTGSQISKFELKNN